jgi:type VI protein secretion system component Hcp
MLTNHKCSKTAICTIATLTAAVTLAIPAAAESSASPVQYVLCIDNVAGPGVGMDFKGCIEVLALGLSVEREIKSASEKAGVEDLNIGVGELAPVSIRKLSDGVSPLLFSYAVNGNSMGNAQLFVREQRPGWPTLLTTMEVKLARSFVRSLRLDSADGVESVDLYFNKIQLTSFERDANGSVSFSSQQCWDTVHSTECSL